MKNKKRLIVFLICFLLVYLLKDKISLYFESTNYVDSNSKTTIVTPVLDHKIIPDKNLIYCSTFQMAWNSLYKDVIKETIEIEDKPWYVDKLNELVLAPPLISNDAYIAVAGLGKDNINEIIKHKLKEKFDLTPRNIKLNPYIGSNDLVIFSYLRKILKFDKPYGTFFHNIKFNNLVTKVKAFGFKQLKGSSEIKQQFKILYLKDSGFIIELLSNSNTDNLIISTFEPEETMLKTFENIQSHIIDNKKNFSTNTRVESLSIPKINFDIETSFVDFNNKKINNKGFENLVFNTGIQKILFKLDEKGARLESFTYFNYVTSSGPIFLEINGPFVLILKNTKSNLPYFMAYFGNDELLEK